MATASSESLAKEDNELREFFTCQILCSRQETKICSQVDLCSGGAFASGSRLDHCCRELGGHCRAEDGFVPRAEPGCVGIQVQFTDLLMMAV